MQEFAVGFCQLVGSLCTNLARNTSEESALPQLSIRKFVHRTGMQTSTVPAEIVVAVPVEIDTLKGALIVAAGVGSGFVNAIVGSGSLISFPVLVGAGFERLAANIANNIGQFPGSISAVVGYRKELVGQNARIKKLVPISFVGSVIGASLLLAYPGSFKQVVPILILVGVVLVLASPHVQKRVKARREASGTVVGVDHINNAALAAVLVAGIYGGYFGAGQGVILVGVLGMSLSDELVRVNALKNVLAMVVNGVAAVVFIARGDIAWLAALLVGIGAIVGAQIGSKVGRKIPANVLRSIIGVVGVAVAINLWRK
jgi:uncharacterized protein